MAHLPRLYPDPEILVSINAYPSYELTVDQVIIMRERKNPSTEHQKLTERVWQYDELKKYISSDNSSTDSYEFDPPENIFGGFFNDKERYKFLTRP